MSRRLGDRKSETEVALKGIKLARDGRRRLDDMQFEDDQLYDSLSEEEYQELISKRKNANEFIVDDDGYGYADNGKEYYDEDDYRYSSDDGNDVKKNASTAKNDGVRKKLKRTEKPQKVNAAFLKSAAAMGNVAKVNSSSLDRLMKKPQEIEQLASLVDDLDKGLEMEVDIPEELSKAEDIALFGQSIQVQEAHRRISRKAASQDVVNALPNSDGDDFNENVEASSSQDRNIKKIRVVSEPPQEIQTLTTDDKPNLAEVSLSVSGFSSLKQSDSSFNEHTKIENGSIELFWTDAYEDPCLPGIIFLIGKISSSTPGSYVSCCVRVENVQRSIFIVPRSTNLESGEDVTMSDVYHEIQNVFSELKIFEFQVKSVVKDFPFTGKNEESISGEFLNVLYPAKYPQLSRELSGKTFSKVLGTKSSCLELFLLNTSLMGPSWISINQANPVSTKLSWCKAEFVVQNPKLVSIPERQEAPPQLSMFSLNLKTILNPKTKIREVVLISWLYHKAVNVDLPTESENDLERLTCVRKLNDQPWPFDFEAGLLQDNLSESVRLFDNERGLISFFLTMLQKIDPDVLVGHNIVNTDLEVLLQRFSDLKLQNVWSRIGRLQRKKVPPSRSQQNETGFFSRISATAGRLLCDTQVSSQELVRETNYSLQNLASIYLKQSTVDIAPNLIPNYFSQTKDLIGLINHSINEAHLAFRLMNKLQILPLTKQLSCLCGNLWSQSLRSARADRVEYLLLHNFFDRNFIVPEKYTSLERRKLNSLLSTSEECEDENDSEQIVDGKRKKKPQYSGGLVLEPKKGLYDEFVLLLDFNSLYPSIIQEFDICFTTTRHWELHEGSVAEDVESIQPEKDMKGLLPKVIKGLVDRRRQVKNMLKNECDTIKKQQLDIRQKALKLVANSMYGCLGFANSRFYCKPLAARITALGRSILSKTVELVESNDYEVIYGDTDSVMVNSRTRELDSAKKIADDIKQKVNSRYTKLDIDLDNIFQRILLLRKKKYAALSLVKNTDGTITSVKELKGLDLVRRDWCPLSRELGCKVVDLLLSGESRSDVVDLIHRQMQQVESAVRNSVIPLEKFIITKCLTKAPHLYPDIKSQPHVKVALEMMKSGRQVNVGDHIPYIVCLGDGSISDRSFYPYTVIKENSDLQVDFDWYLSNQILAPISRLCEPIEGVDEARLAASLGLDSSRYKSSTSVIQGGSVGASDSGNFALDVHNQNYEEAFKDAEKLMIKCSSCQNEQEFVGMQAQDGKLLHCKSEGCGHLFKDVDFHSLSNTLVLALRRHLKRFYQKIVVCDSDCDLKYGTRHLGGELGKCYMPDCPGSLSYEYPPHLLHKQLRYYESLLNVKKAEGSSVKNSIPEHLTYVTQALSSLHEIIDGILSRCEYHWIDPGKIFATEARAHQ